MSTSKHTLEDEHPTSRSVQGIIYSKISNTTAEKKHPTLREVHVDDIAASEDIPGEIILYKTLRENIFVYFIMWALYI